jgi:hypothetical protein
MSITEVTQIIGGAIVAIVLVTTIHSGWKTALALRAKMRANAILQEDEAGDMELRMLIAKVRHQRKLTLEQQDLLSKAIQSKLAKRLSEKDQKVVEEGLHQSSVRGAQRFIKELAGAA